MALIYTRFNIVRGLIIYAAGDTVASIIQHQFSLTRMLGMMLVGATVYAFEIPNYFAFLDRKIPASHTLTNSLKRAALSVAYFNPLWVARHMLFIKLFSGHWSEISWDLLRVASFSFVVSLPITFTANYLIQNKVRYDIRFMVSACFSALMAVYYALAAFWFK